MGTSLSGLTPATTFDGLLKTSDNEPLDGTLKAISTGDGTDTILDLSTTAFKISGETTIVGNGNDNTTTALLVQNSDGDDILNLTDGALATLGTTGQQGEINLKRPQDGLAIGKIQGTNNGLYLTNQDASNHILIGNSSTRGVSVGDGSASAMGARFGIKGSGTTSATTSLLVQNSAGTNVFKVVDDNTMFYHTHKFRSAGGYLYIECEANTDRSLKIGPNFTASSYGGHIFKTWDGSAYSEAMRITGNTDQFVGIGTTTPTARLHVKGSGNDNTTTSLLVQNSDAENIMAITDDGYLTYRTPQRELLTLGNGSVLKYGTNSSFSALYNRASIYDGTNTTQFENGNVGIGNGTTTPSARLQVKGSGTTSATTSLLVQNSAGTRLMEVQDGGNIFFGAGTSNYLQNGYNWFGNYNALGSWNIGGATTEASAIVNVQSTTKGFLPPRMTTTERDAITTPAAGLMVYNTTTNKAQCYNGTTWNDLF